MSALSPNSIRSISSIKCDLSTESPGGQIRAVLSSGAMISFGSREFGYTLSYSRYYGPHMVNCMAFMNDDILVVGLDHGTVEFFHVPTRKAIRYRMSRGYTTRILAAKPTVDVPAVLLFFSVGYPQVWTKKHVPTSSLFEFHRTDFVLAEDVRPELTVFASDGTIVDASDYYGHGRLRIWKAGAAKTGEYKLVETRVRGMTSLDLTRDEKNQIVLILHAEDGTSESWTFSFPNLISIEQAKQ